MNKMRKRMRLWMATGVLPVVVLATGYTQIAAEGLRRRIDGALRDRP